MCCLHFFPDSYLRTHSSRAEPTARSQFLELHLNSNTAVTLKIYDSKDETLLDDALAICDQYEEYLQPYERKQRALQAESQDFAHKMTGHLRSPPDFADLVSKGLYYSRLSGGGFDITIEPISSMWDFVSDAKILPDDAALKNALPLVNYENVTLGRRPNPICKRWHGT